MIRGEPSGPRCARWPQSMLGSAPGGRVKLSTASSPSRSMPASAPLASSSAAPTAGGAARPTLLGVVRLVDTRGLDVVFLHQLAEVLAIDVGGARGMRDVAAVAPQE